MSDLHRIANQPGFGTGKAARDRMAEEAEALALLPEPGSILPVHASTDLYAGLMICGFGRSGEDGADWYLMTDRVTDMERDFTDFPSDARDDARIVAAILNAYRMGLLVRRDAK